MNMSMKINKNMKNQRSHLFIFVFILVKSSQELIPGILEAEHKQKTRGLPTGWAGCAGACGSPAAGRLRGLSVRARALRI